MFAHYAFSVVMFALSVWCTVCACRDQRRIWRSRFRWQLRDPLTEPSTTALVMQRLRFLLGAVGGAAIAIAVLLAVPTTDTGPCGADHDASAPATDC